MAQRGAGGVGQGGRVAFGGQHVRAGVAGEGLGDGEALEIGDRRGGAAVAYRGGEGGAEVGLGFVHQAGERGARPIPFQHGEFGRVGGAALFAAPDAGELEDRAGAGREQPLHGEFGAGVQP